MDALLITCPNAECKKPLSIRVKPEKPTRKCRCPKCKTLFEMTVRAQAKQPEEEDVGAYDFAPETSLTYLLQREADGFPLTPEERTAKKRLLKEGLKANPEACPACQTHIGARGVVCVQCGLNLKTGKRLKTTVEHPELEPSDHGGGVSRDTASDAAGLVVDVVLTILGG